MDFGHAVKVKLGKLLHVERRNISLLNGQMKKLRSIISINH
jgi:hypothetical protein